VVKDGDGERENDEVELNRAETWVVCCWEWVVGFGCVVVWGFDVI
jgi:hypothetical protein